MNTPTQRAYERAQWRKASRSSGTGNDCVELAGVEGIVGVRDSRDPDGPKLAFSRSEMAALASRIKAGGLDL
jgi:hypothetical protein